MGRSTRFKRHQAAPSKGTDRPVENDPIEIPVQPIPFEHGLIHFAQSLNNGQSKIVAIGSSTTAGEGGIVPYPGRLLQSLQSEYSTAIVAMVNKGISSQEAPIEFQRFGTDVIPATPNLVIWQVGTNAVWQRPDLNPPPPSFDDTISAIREGLAELREKTQADVILMDLQYLPAVLTPTKKEKAFAMVDAISRVANAAGVNVFRRFAFMKSLMDIEGVPLDRMVDPTDNDRLHGSDWVTGRVAWALRIAIVDGVKKARASMTAKQ
jgi:lysophospholipase L1-like esterase